MPKPRHPQRTVFQSGGRTFVREIVHPGRWKYRHLLEQYDAEHGKDGAWLSVVDEVFGESWLLEQKDMRHELARAMFWPFAGSIQTIADAADLVIALRQARSGSGSVIKRMQVHEQFDGSTFEARVARFLVESDLPFILPPSNGGHRAFDMRAVGTLPFAIEVKCRQRSSRSWSRESLSAFVFNHLMLDLLGFDVVFDWSGPDAQKLNLAYVQEGVVDEMASKAVRAIQDGLATKIKHSSTTIGVDGLGTITLRRSYPLGDSASSSTVLDEAWEARRLAKTIGKASQQFDGVLPGVVFLCASAGDVNGDIAPEAVAEYFAIRGQELPDIAGAVVFTLSCNDAISERTQPVANPYARVELASLPLPECRAPTWRERLRVEDRFAILDSTVKPGPD